MDELRGGGQTRYEREAELRCRVVAQEAAGSGRRSGLRRLHQERVRGQVTVRVREE